MLWIRCRWRSISLDGKNWHKNEISHWKPINLAVKKSPFFTFSPFLSFARPREREKWQFRLNDVTKSNCLCDDHEKIVLFDDDKRSFFFLFVSFNSFQWHKKPVKFSTRKVQQNERKWMWRGSSERRYQFDDRNIACAINLLSFVVSVSVSALYVKLKRMRAKKNLSKEKKRRSKVTHITR